MEQINEKKFLNYMIKNSIQNLSMIKGVKFNKKSITLKIDKNLSSFIDNNYINLKIVLRFLILYVTDNNIDFIKDMDFLLYEYEKLNIKYV